MPNCEFPLVSPTFPSFFLDVSLLGSVPVLVFRPVAGRAIRRAIPGDLIRRAPIISSAYPGGNVTGKTFMLVKGPPFHCRVEPSRIQKRKEIELGIGSLIRRRRKK